MLNLIKCFFIAVIFYTGLNAHAGIWIEPGVGYITGQVDDGTPPKDDVTGTMFDLKLGYSMMGLAIGADYQTGTATIKTSAGSDTSKPKDLGIFVGYKLPILLKASASYFFSSTTDYSVSGTDFVFKGSGMKVGIGYTGLPIVSLNFDYCQTTYNKYEVAGLSGDLTNNVVATTYMISISAPFDL